MLAMAATVAAMTVPCSFVVITYWEGPPTPYTGSANLAGAYGIGTPAGTILPAALPTPGPPAALQVALEQCQYFVGEGPSTVMETKFSLDSNTRLKNHFSLYSGCFAFFGLSS